MTHESIQPEIDPITLSGDGQVVPLEEYDALYLVKKPSRTFIGREGDERSQPIDYANFPVGLAYVSRADVIAAYMQGKRDGLQDASALIIEKLETE